jgi:ABC-type multidrug transport system fused ATPase/permease subunit
MIKFYIPHKKKGEEIIILLRRHWFVLIKRLSLWVVAALIPIVVYLITGQTVPLVVEGTIFEPILIVFGSIFYLFIWLFAFNGFIDYYLDVWIVTNVRIINIEQRQIFSRVISEHELDKIQDVTSEVHGIIATFLNYGEVFVQTAGQQQRFVFKEVSNPQNIKRKIISICDYRKKYLKTLKGKSEVHT